MASYLASRDWNESGYEYFFIDKTGTRLVVVNPAFYAVECTTQRATVQTVSQIDTMENYRLWYTTINAHPIYIPLIDARAAVTPEIRQRVKALRGFEDAFHAGTISGPNVTMDFQPVDPVKKFKVIRVTTTVL
jgi:hypothetical protein